jgi:hypothetical protein
MWRHRLLNGECSNDPGTTTGHSATVRIPRQPLGVVYLRIARQNLLINEGAGPLANFDDWSGLTVLYSTDAEAFPTRMLVRHVSMTSAWPSTLHGSLWLTAATLILHSSVAPMKDRQVGNTSLFDPRCLICLNSAKTVPLRAVNVPMLLIQMPSTAPRRILYRGSS